MSWNLFLDDLRAPSWVYPDYCDLGQLEWVIARSSDEAKQLVLDRGPPERCSLDHDLGWDSKNLVDDTTMIFLKWFADEYPQASTVEYRIHSANIVGSENIRSFMESWKKSNR